MALLSTALMPRKGAISISVGSMVSAKTCASEIDKRKSTVRHHHTRPFWILFPSPYDLPKGEGDLPFFVNFPIACFEDVADDHCLLCLV